jgi:hypothetical protein
LAPDCLCRAEERSKKGKSACDVDLPDLEQKRAAGRAARMVELRLVKNT